MQTETIENFLPLQQASYGGLRKFVLFYKKNLVRLPESILKAGVKLITNFRGRLGDECKISKFNRVFPKLPDYLVLEDLFHASIECQQFEVAKVKLDLFAQISHLISLLLPNLKTNSKMPLKSSSSMVKVISNNPKWSGIYKESTGEREEAEAAYDYILSENPLNLVALFIESRPF